MIKPSWEGFKGHACIYYLAPGQSHDADNSSIGSLIHWMSFNDGSEYVMMTALWYRSQLASCWVFLFYLSGSLLHLWGPEHPRYVTRTRLIIIVDSSLKLNITHIIAPRDMKAAEKSRILSWNVLTQCLEPRQQVNGEIFMRYDRDWKEGGLRNVRVNRNGKSNESRAQVQWIETKSEDSFYASRITRQTAMVHWDAGEEVSGGTGTMEWPEDSQDRLETQPAECGLLASSREERRRSIVQMFRKWKSFLLSLSHSMFFVFLVFKVKSFYRGFLFVLLN